MRIHPHTFRPRDLVGGHVAVDLANTVTARNAEPVDWLHDYRHLLAWAELTGEFDPRALRELATLATEHPRAASAALSDVRLLRETVHDLLVAIVREATPPPRAQRELEARWRRAVAATRFVPSAGGLRPEPSLRTSGLGYLEHELVLRTVELLQELPPHRLRGCPGPSCGWLFIDRSKGGRRRWCDMATCGNAAKGRRYYDRHHRTPRSGASKPPVPRSRLPRGASS